MTTNEKTNHVIVRIKKICHHFHRKEKQEEPQREDPNRPKCNFILLNIIFGNFHPLFFFIAVSVFLRGLQLPA